MSKTLHFSQHIEAPRATVWRLMLDDAAYRDWTSAFCEGSYYEGSWEQGGELRFLSPDGQGILSRVVERQEGSLIRLRHQAEIENFQVKADEASDWKDAAEDYELHDEATGTHLEISSSVPDSYESMMREMWPKGLLRLKALCERSAAAPT